MAGYIGHTVSVATSGTEHKKVFTATSGQTSFTGLSYTPTKVHVFMNGVRLIDGTDYTASNGTSITLTVGATTDDQLVVVSYATFQASDTVSASIGGTFLSGVTFEDTATFEGTTTFEDTASFNVSGTPFVANRIGSTGTILDFQKDGVEIGTMGTVGGEFYIGSLSGNDAFLKFESDILSPSDNAGVARNNAIDLGKSVSAFKDLYLGGGVYLGGTGSANKLEDYEEGTWTASLGARTSQTGDLSYANQTGRYIKIGNMVFVSVFLRWTQNNITASSGPMELKGLPFTQEAQNDYRGGFSITYSEEIWTGVTIYQQAFRSEHGETNAIFNYSDGTDGSMNSSIFHSNLQTTGDMMITGTYTTI